MAFFPCVRFTKLAIWHLNGTTHQLKNYTAAEKLEYSMKYHDELNFLYRKICEMFIVCERKGLQLIVENPYSDEHYLTRYFPALPAIIDRDRTERGDYQVKPTQFYFVNRKPNYNCIFEILEPVEHFTHFNAQKKRDFETEGRKDVVSRSLIHPQYANRFIREFILE